MCVCAADTEEFADTEELASQPMPVRVGEYMGMDDAGRETLDQVTDPRSGTS